MEESCSQAPSTSEICLQDTQKKATRNTETKAKKKKQTKPKKVKREKQQEATGTAVGIEIEGRERKGGKRKKEW